MNLTELIWAIVGLAAGLALSMLALWTMLTLDAGRLRRSIRRLRSRQAIFGTPEPAPKPVSPVVIPVLVEEPEITAPPLASEAKDIAEPAPVVVEPVPTELRDQVEQEAVAAEIEPEPASEEPAEATKALPDIEDTEEEPIQPDAPTPEPAAPASVEDLFASAFRGAPSPKSEAPVPLAEWRPAKPRSQQPKG